MWPMSNPRVERELPASSGALCVRKSMLREQIIGRKGPAGQTYKAVCLSSVTDYPIHTWMCVLPACASVCHIHA